MIEHMLVRRMKTPSLKKLQTAIICIGITVTVFGFLTHFYVPSEIRSNYPIRLEASSYSTNRISFSAVDVDYTLQIHLRLDFLYQNLSAYLLEASEFERFSTGTPLYEVAKIAEFTGFPTYEWELTPIEDIDFYVVIFNNNSVPVFCGYYYTILPSTFFLTLSIGFIGLFVILAGFGWQLVGWKRYFIIGLGINFVLFYLRTFALVGDVFSFSAILDLTIEPYKDYVFFYLRWVPELWEGVWPYSLDISSTMVDYVYPPLWIYTIGLLGSTPAWLPGLILFAFNMATGVVVFGITHELTQDEKRSAFAMMVYMLNPLTLLYGSYLWLNPTPYVFFVIMSFYLALKNRKTQSIVAMAAAVLYKQFAIVFFPLLIIALVKQDKDLDLRRSLVSLSKYFLIFIAVIGLVSVPFLLVDSNAYIGSLFTRFTTPESLATFHPELSWPINFNTFFVWISGPNVITWAIAYLIAYYILLGSSLILIYISFARFRSFNQTEAQNGASRNKQVIVEALFWSILLILALQLFFPRGAYKFYLLILVPFVSILFDHHDLKLSQTGEFAIKKHHFTPIVFSLAVMLCFRLVYFWIILVWAVFLLWKSGRIKKILK